MSESISDPLTPDRVAVAIVGAGFSGSMTAVHLHQLGVGPIALIERRGDFGPGLAYSTADARHRLNVQAESMSAFPSRPDHFLAWASRRDPSIGPLSFVSRQLYGEYLRELVDEASGPNTGPFPLHRIQGSVVALHTAATGENLILQLDSGRKLIAEHVVLATGNPAPAPIPGVDDSLAGSELLVGDVWGEDTSFDQLCGDRSVLLVGTGLTMVDVALSLRRRGQGPKVQAVSRHGLMPCSHLEGVRHADCGPPALPGPAATVQELMPPLIAALASASSRGQGWRQVVDSIRPMTSEIWQSLDINERRWFLENVSRFWEVHRHRIAPDIAAAIDRMVASGGLRVRAAHIISVTGNNRGVAATIRPAGSDSSETLHVDRIINCTGPCYDPELSGDPLFTSLIDHGLARVDDLRLGFETDADGRLVEAEGTPSRLLSTLGPLRRGELWETTAVPEIRGQAEALANRLARELGSEGLSQGPQPAGPLPIAA